MVHRVFPLIFHDDLVSIVIFSDPGRGNHIYKMFLSSN